MVAKPKPKPKPKPTERPPPREINFQGQKFGNMQSTTSKPLSTNVRNKLKEFNIKDVIGE